MTGHRQTLENLDFPKGVQPLKDLKNGFQKKYFSESYECFGFLASAWLCQGFMPLNAVNPLTI